MLRGTRGWLTPWVTCAPPCNGSSIKVDHSMKRASPSDIQQLVMMMDEFYAEGGYPLNHQRATEAFATLLADDRRGYVWFIQTDSQNVGYVVLTLCYSMEYG